MLYVVEIMQKKGYKIVVVIPEDGPLKLEVEKLGAEVHIINLGILRRKYFTPCGILGRVLLWIQAMVRLTGIAWSKNVNLVYSNTSGVILGSVLAAITRKKHFWHIHEIIEKPKILAKIIGWLTKCTSKVIVVSEAVKNAWLPYIKEEKLIVIHNGIDHAGKPAFGSTLKKELGLSEETLLIGMIGRVIYWKGQLYFLEIAGLLRNSFPNAHFVMVGDAFPGYEYLYGEIENKIVSLKLNGLVHNLGYRTDTSNILSGLNLFISPSTMPDPFPTVVLEAMSCGTPIAATGHGGVLEMLVDHESGLFLPIENAELAAEIISELLESKKKLIEMGKNAQALQQSRFTKALFEKDINRLLAD
jgi:glycosyltransferase involved in cell wall biosynthesis